MSSLSHVTAYLCVKDAAKAIAFYTAAFGAVERYRLPNGSGGIAHAEFTIGDTVLFLSDEWDPQRVYSPLTLNGNSVSFVLAVPDADVAWQRALDAGATIERPLADTPVGRGGWVRDPFGHRWSITTPNPDFDPATLTAKAGD